MAFWNDIATGFRRGLKDRTGGPEEHETDLPVMSFGDHLGELRRRVILALLGAMVGVSICLIFSDSIINAVYQPYLLALRWGGFPLQIYYHKTTGSIISYLMTGFKAGLVVSSPWIIYQAWCFVASGLYLRERRIVYQYIAPSILLFLAGVAFFYFLVLPVLLKFIIGFNLSIHVPPVKPYGVENSVFGKALPGVNIAKLPTGDQAKPLLIPMVKSDPTHFPKGAVAIWFNAARDQVRIHVGRRTLTLRAQPASSLFAPLPNLSEYLSFVSIMSLIFGVSFELPMVMLVLAKIGLVKARQFRQMWRFAVMGLALLAVVLAPTPDFFTFLCIFIPLLFLYLLGLVLSAVADRNRAKSAARDEEDNHDDPNGGPPVSPQPPEGPAPGAVAANTELVKPHDGGAPAHPDAAEDGEGSAPADSAEYEEGGPYDAHSDAQDHSYRYHRSRTRRYPGQNETSEEP